MTKELLQQALEALIESRDDVNTCLYQHKPFAGRTHYDTRIAFYEQQLVKHDAAIEGLKQALAQQEQPAHDPYGWVRPNPGFNSGLCNIGAVCPTGWIGSATPVYTHPAPTQPALSGEEIRRIVKGVEKELWPECEDADWRDDDTAFYGKLVSAIEAHCLGGADHE